MSLLIVIACIITFTFLLAGSLAVWEQINEGEMYGEHRRLSESSEPEAKKGKGNNNNSQAVWGKHIYDNDSKRSVPTELLRRSTESTKKQTAETGKQGE